MHIFNTGHTVLTCSQIPIHKSSNMSEVIEENHQQDWQSGKYICSLWTAGMEQLEGKKEKIIWSPANQVWFNVRLPITTLIMLYRQTQPLWVHNKPSAEQLQLVLGAVVLTLNTSGVLWCAISTWLSCSPSFPPLLISPISKDAPMVLRNSNWNELWVWQAHTLMVCCWSWYEA